MTENAGLSRDIEAIELGFVKRIEDSRTHRESPIHEMEREATPVSSSTADTVYVSLVNPGGVVAINLISNLHGRCLALASHPFPFLYSVTLRRQT